jgi:simple sugar transport system ATP-binding protein
MYAVQMQGITKQFGTLVANDRVDFHLARGEIHALLGENGAGKTTLMRILYGLYRADAGQIFVDGQEAHIQAPRDAIARGIGMVTQHFTLVPTLTVAENVVLGSVPGVRFDPRAVERQVREAMDRFGVELKPQVLVRHLSVGERQRVEIFKALYRNAHVLILDEPTAVLVPQEVDVLIESLQRLRMQGLSVIFISHKLNEVMAMCDRVTVLRDGKAIGTVARADTSPTHLAGMMVGRPNFGVTRAALPGDRRPAAPGLLQIDGVQVADKKGLPALKGISLAVQAGEILGIAGVSGNGQSELSQVLAGTLKPTAGRIVVDGQDLAGATPARFTANGVGRIPEDRHEGVVGELTVAENLALENLGEFMRGGVLDRPRIQEHAARLIAEFQIKASPGDRTRGLSGGNMQKVILARTLSRQPKVVIAAQPTRGLDVGATDYVRSKLLEQRARGAAVLLLSEDLDEIRALSDRIAVIYEGQITGTFAAGEVDLETLGLYMSGANRRQHVRPES